MGSTILAEHACDLGSDYADYFFDIVSQRERVFKDMDAAIYCKHDAEVHREALYMLSGVLAVLCAQVMIFAIVVDNHRTALSGMKAAISKELSYGDLKSPVSKTPSKMATFEMKDELDNWVL